MALPVCPVCSGAPAATLVERHAFPIFVNRVEASREAARSVARGEVTFVACASCGHVWNRTFEPERLVFDPSYNPDQVGSPAFDKHIADIADRITHACGHLSKIDMIEIGCGQGDFMQQMVNRLDQPRDRVRSARGFDPAFWHGKPRFTDPRISVERKYFDTATADAMRAQDGGGVNLVISRQAVQHVPFPQPFYKDIRKVVTDDARIFIEAPDVTSIFEHRTTYDLFYEHCCLYAPSSMDRALRDAGFSVTSVAPAFNGQYLLASASVSGSAWPAPPVSSPRSLVAQDNAFVAWWTEKLQAAKKHGPIFLWGAGAKGASFCLMVDPNAELVSGLIDINKTKHGKFVPGTGHEIIPPTDERVLAAKTVIVSNPIYKNEIAASLEARGATPELMTLDDCPR